MTHCRSTVVKCMASCADGRATFIAVSAVTTVANPTPITARASQRERSLTARSRTSGPVKGSVAMSSGNQSFVRATTLGEPRRGVRANPVDEGKKVVCGPLLGDFSVRQAVHIDRIPPDMFARRRDPKEIPLVRSLDRRAHGHDVSFRNDVLLDIADIREGGDD